MPVCNSFLTEVSEIYFNCVIRREKKMQYYWQYGVIPFYKMEGMVGHTLMFSDCFPDPEGNS